MDCLPSLQQRRGPKVMVSDCGATRLLTTEQHMSLHGTRADVLARVALVNLGYLRNNKQGLKIADACDKIRECIEELEALAQLSNNSLPPRPDGQQRCRRRSNKPVGAIRTCRAGPDSGVLLEPMADGYWTPWHIANSMLSNPDVVQVPKA